MGGNHINTYSLATALVSHGLPPSSLTLVLPEECILGHAAMDQHVRRAWAALGATVHTGAVTECRGSRDLQGVVVDGTEIACEAYITTLTPTTPTSLFHAVNNAFLVFDNGIVINNQLQTSDSSILAVGLHRFLRSPMLTITCCVRLGPAPSTVASITHRSGRPTSPMPKAERCWQPRFGTRWIH